MALSQLTHFSSLVVSLNKHNLSGEAQTLRTFKPPTAVETSKSFLLSSFPPPRNKPFSPRRDTISYAGDESSSPLSTSISSVFVKGLVDSVSEGRLRKVFSELGEVKNVKIIANEKTQKSLGYGYVWFESRESAELAVEAMNGKVYSC